MRATRWVVACAAIVALMACGKPPEDRAGAASASAAELRDDPTSPRFAHAPPFEAPRRGQAASEQITQLSRQVEELRGDVEALRAQVASSAASAAAASTPGHGLDAQGLAATEAAFRGEVVDPHWSREMAENVRSTLAQVDQAHGPPRSVECRSRSCRVELEARDAARVGADLAPALERLGSALPRATAGQAYDADGRKVTVVYLSR